MESRIFYSTKFYNIFENQCCTIAPNTIYLGNYHNRNWKVYFHFEIDSIPSEAIIDHAHLILYERDIGVHIENEWYQVLISPTCDYINPFFYHDQPCLTDERQKGVYSQSSRNYMLKIDVKKLVENWVMGKVVNYGCILELDGYNELRTFAGAQFKGVEPFLKVSYTLPKDKILYCYEEEIKLPSKVEKVD